MEPLQVAKQIIAVIEAIKKEGALSQELIDASAMAEKNYDKEVAVQSIKHRDAGMSVTMIKDQARGDASDALYQKLMCNGMLKAHWQRLDYLKAQLNGLQSVNRHLDNV